MIAKMEHTRVSHDVETVCRYFFFSFSFSPNHGIYFSPSCVSYPFCAFFLSVLCAPFPLLCSPYTYTFKLAPNRERAVERRARTLLMLLLARDKYFQTVMDRYSSRIV